MLKTSLRRKLRLTNVTLYRYPPFGKFIGVEGKLRWDRRCKQSLEAKKATSKVGVLTVQHSKIAQSENLEHMY